MRIEELGKELEKVLVELKGKINEREDKIVRGSGSEKFL
jgi:hypothetical protein